MTDLERLTTHAIKGSLGTLVSPARMKRRREFMLDDDILHFSSFDTRRYIRWRVIAFYVGCVLSCGALFLLSTWEWFRLPLLLWMTTSTSTKEAEFAIVTACDGAYEICHVEPIASVEKALLDPGSDEFKTRSLSGVPMESRMIVYRHSRFVISPDGIFTLLDCEASTAATPPVGGLSSEEAAARLKLYGCNIIDITVPPWWVLLGREATNPFTIFQVGSCRCVAIES